MKIWRDALFCFVIVSSALIIEVQGAPADGAINVALTQDCVFCDGPSLPNVGRTALKESNDNAYKAVQLLMPAAAAGDVSSQISIAFIMRYRLTGHLKGTAREPFTWREVWAWYLIAAQSDARMASLLGAGYAFGDRGLPKNKDLGECLALQDARPLKNRVAECFKRYGR